ncbi:hypothetical protein [Parapedobacter sp. 10938]|uniref:hypothetical protein n=1 Tax=Parapedobacter flavus TaxID=3110225 RepID=UPI002DBAC32C|nr:hypothetical protein [Parapedobacter sp. 10938]MEC3882038.1 hypothetical protein [Parapedobacter sp. 10938]
MGFLNRYDWHMKSRFLWVGGLVFLIACYQLAIKPTIRLRDEYRALKAGEQVREANTLRLNELRTKAQQTGTLAGGVTDGARDKRSEPERIAMMAQKQGVAVRNLPAPERLGTANPTSGAASWYVDYSTYRLEGGFTGLLQVLRDVEQQADINLLSTSFVKQSNPATREPELNLLLRTVRLVNDGEKDSL